ncbi:hypothetical protein GCM10029963_69250 [Micromonospora andamanensis]|uniref:hypothetical protein n=1 Tax=Micromonospora andamanensis TaxID=1287068 RepID=UPI001951BFA9|nr:hypothetical protein [Micromonospora andamanensis]GIJ38904.1 hypothetical protein Vwe01_22290 [Micromonospora andamanensis]
MTEQPPAVGSPSSHFEAEPLGRWERLGASALGLVAAAGGGWAVFATDNQAGSAVLVIIGAAFLLMGLQGTPLIRVGSVDSGVELERRRRRVEKAIEQARQEESPEIAAGIVEAASIIEPRIFRSAHYRSELYTSKVAMALLAADATVERHLFDYGPDLTVSTGMGTAYVEVKYRERGPLRMQDVQQLEKYSRGPHGLLIVTNASLSPEVESYNADEANRHVEAVTWNGEEDSGLLVRALMRVAAAGGAPGYG